MKKSTLPHIAFINLKRAFLGLIFLIFILSGTHTYSQPAAAALVPPDLKESYDAFIKIGLKAVEDSGKIKFIDTIGRNLIEIADGTLIYKYNGFGGDIKISNGKTTTVLGKFSEDFSNPNSGGTRYFLGSAASPVVIGYPNGSISRGDGTASPDRLNFLDIPEPFYNALINVKIVEALDSVLGKPSKLDLASISTDDAKKMITTSFPSLTSAQVDALISIGLTRGKNLFWEKYNLPFLKQSCQRGDDIRLVSDPRKYQPYVIQGGSYKLELDSITNLYGLAQEYGYTYDAKTCTFSKK